MPEQLEMVLRLLLAALLCGIIGFQRERSGKQAGVRTLGLIGLGSALFAVISATAFTNADLSRIAAGVVTGIGFLGAGAILHRHGGVEGLTTAAAIWVTAGIGMAAGTGLYLLSVVVTVIAVLILLVPHIPPSKVPPAERKE
jgi:putative Mg2+ transporter-C (MgtC) family protein